MRKHGGRTTFWYRSRLLLVLFLCVLTMGLIGCGIFDDDDDDDDKTLAIEIVSPATDLTVYVGESANFQSSLTGGASPFAYSWDFDGGASNSTVEDPGDVVFDTAGTYTVGITVTDSKGGSASDSVIVTVLTALSTTRDDKGVWFISGDSGESVYNVFEAMGYAVATDRLWQAELYRRQSRGTLAEIFGAGQLETDILVRTIGYTDAEMEAAFAELSAEIQQVINGYVAGFNRRIQETRNDPTQLPFEFVALGQQLGEIFIPADWTYKDVLAWFVMLQRNFDPEALNQDQLDNAELMQALTTEFGAAGAGMFQDLRWTNDPEAQTYIVDEGAGILALSRSLYQGAGLDALPQTALRSDANFAAAARAIENRHEAYVENLKQIDAYVKMGSYAWVVAGEHTDTGNPMIYSGPQMGFSVPSIVLEGSIDAAGLQVSGMTVAGIPGIIIGRTPHHAWSMQVGHAHTVDYYFENPAEVTTPHRMETIKVAGAADVVLPVYRTAHGPVVNPVPYNPLTYDSATEGPVVSWKYAHWGYELKAAEGFLALSKAVSMDEFGAGIEKFGVSQHFCYADREGNIAYWMSGRNPARPAGEWRLPQGAVGTALEWDAAVLMERSTDRNAARGFYGGWNNKTHPDYDNCYNSTTDIYGPFHRAHVIYEYLEDKIDNQEKLSFEEVRDLALNIAATDSFGGGGNPWVFVKDYFVAAVNAAGANADRESALTALDAWDGHFVEGGADQWAEGTDRPDAWILMDAWIDEVLRLTFADEGVGDQPDRLLFNVLIHGLADNPSGIQNTYDWFSNLNDAGAPQTAEDIIVEALDTVLVALGSPPWGTGQRGTITYSHQMLGPVHTTPFSSRSTYAHCVEYGSSGPVRIESMFPLGESGDIRAGAGGSPVFDDHFFSMAKDGSGNPILYDLFEMRIFPLFD